MGAVVDDTVEEGARGDALAHEPALHVRECDDERVHAAVVDARAELFESRMAAGGMLVVGHARLSLGSGTGLSAAIVAERRSMRRPSLRPLRPAIRAGPRP